MTHRNGIFRFSRIGTSWSTAEEIGVVFFILRMVTFPPELSSSAPLTNSGGGQLKKINSTISEISPPPGEISFALVTLGSQCPSFKRSIFHLTSQWLANPIRWGHLSNSPMEHPAQIKSFNYLDPHLCSWSASATVITDPGHLKGTFIRGNTNSGTVNFSFSGGHR